MKIKKDHPDKVPMKRKKNSIPASFKASNSKETKTISSLQCQIDSLTSTVALLMDKYDSVEIRSLKTEQRLQTLMESPYLRNKKSTYEERNSN